MEIHQKKGIVHESFRDSTPCEASWCRHHLYFSQSKEDCEILVAGCRRG